MHTNKTNDVISDADKYPINIFANMGMMALGMGASLSLLWLASHASLGWALLAAAGFAIFNNTLFAVMHEAIHGMLLPWRRLNNLLGIICGAMFPVPFCAYTYGHAQHHERNRTDVELFDYYLPGDVKWKRNLWLYVGNLGGIYWLILPLGTVLYTVMPGLTRSKHLQRWADQLGIGAGFSDVRNLPPLTSWLQSVFVVAWQVSMFYLLDLSWQGWLLCYAAFALHWSALQYTHHAWSVRNVLNGAWNLRVFAPVRWLSLNYHYHLAHHRLPQIPWVYLGMFVSEEEERPGFLHNYLKLWGGVRPAPPMEPITMDQAPSNET